VLSSRLWRIVGCVVVATVIAGGPASPTRADETPTFLGWSSALPPGSLAPDPGSTDDCRAGRPTCVDAVVRRMQKQLNAFGCSHQSPFAITYLRVTQAVRSALDVTGFFVDPGYVAREDQVFADMYFQAYANWSAGTGPLPEAWRIAFDAARNERVGSATNVMLGINAHVNRDLPFMLYQVGLVAPDGSSRKYDHDQINPILNSVQLPIVREIARRLDPTIDDANAPGTLDDTALFQPLEAWREEAWRNAERLAAAPTQEAREDIARQIEAAAAGEAVLLRDAGSYPPLLNAAEIRNAYCATHFA
jgi:hypothetical protein